ncbi:TBC1 domain family member 7 [Drosophila navojoa]|uniref:TBC1 domain family member 7 n=1 Tax=Drosophila navojoa TaxID=7232 RepID=UPI0008465D4C|nr:TBC1 domain family member 7 [Drosophila navojoa]XP_017953513.1 TBC1 domain family member 7 [Drosophila navojoa]
MTTDERNFRSSYYEKVGCFSVEEKKSLNKLLQDDIRNPAKLKHFVYTFTVPAQQRSLLWSLIMGIMPLHKSNTEYVREQRRQVYEDLLRAVNVMRFVDVDKSRHLVLYKMWLLENNRLLHSNVRVGSQPDDNHFIEIVRTLLEIFDNEMETYWIAKGFYQYTRELKKECGKLKELTQVLLKREDIALFYGLEKLELFDVNSKLLDDWYTTCFAGVICETVLVKIWDKVCGGAKKIVVFLFIELMKDIRSFICDLRSQEELKVLVEMIKDQDGVIVNKAIKSWHSNNSEVEYVH